LKIFNLKKNIDNLNNLSHLINYYKESPKAYLSVIFFATIASLFELIGITSILPAISFYLGESNINMPTFIKDLIETVGIEIILVLFVFIIILQTFLLYISESYFLKKMGTWRTKLSLEYIDNLLEADFKFINKLKPGEAETIITRNVGYAVRNRHKTALFLSNWVISLFYLLIAIYLSPQVFILFFLLGLFYIILNRKFLKLRVYHSGESNSRYLKAAQILSEHLSDFRGIQTSNKKQLNNILNESLNKAAKHHVANDVINAGINLIGQPIMILMLFIGIFISKYLLSIDNTEILVMIYIFYRASPKLISISKGYAEIIQDSPIDLTPEILKWRKRRRLNLIDKNSNFLTSIIKAENLSFSHGNNLILNKLNFTINKGELFLIRGKSGGGKSTLLDLICGFIKPSKGSINVFGLTPSILKYENYLLPFVSILREESNIIEGTLVDNISYLNTDQDMNLIKDLIFKVGLDDLYSKGGIDFNIKSKGSNLSAGQRQRLLIARALYKKPRLLILDEPTSNLDVKTENQINGLLTSLKTEMTIIMISHSSLILKDADQVYDIVEGKAVKIK
tara:strand:+ start:5216 stop:6919 length:1704 start_codon:yes stop_codon:yes gene_type:complete